MSFSTLSKTLREHISSRIPEVKYVGDLVDLDFINHNTTPFPQAAKLPAVYVFPEKTTANPINTIGHTQQEILLNIGILIALSSQSLGPQSSQNSTLSSLDNLHQKLIHNLIGFQHSSWPRTFSPLSFSSSKLHDVKNHLVLWKQSYSLSLFVSNP